MRHRRIGHALLGVIGTGLCISACGAPAKTANGLPRSDLLAVAPSLVALVRLAQQGNHVSGVIRIMGARGATTDLVRQLHGTLRHDRIDLVYDAKDHGQSVSFEGTVASDGIEGDLRLGPSMMARGLSFRPAKLEAYEGAAQRLRTRILVASRTAAVRGGRLDALATMRSEVSKLSRDASALGVDVQALEANLGSETADVASVARDLQFSQSLASSTPGIRHNAICNSVARVRTDATNVVNDDQFVDGFVEGLTKTRTSVAKEAVTVRSHDVSMRAAIRADPGAGYGSVPSESQVQVVLSEAIAAGSLARTTANSVVASLNANASEVFTLLNRAIVSTRCGTEVHVPAPLHAISN